MATDKKSGPDRSRNTEKTGNKSDFTRDNTYSEWPGQAEPVRDTLPPPQPPKDKK